MSCHIICFFNFFIVIDTTAFFLRFTSVKAFRDAVSETADLAGQHEVISETLTANVYNEISTLIKELKEERKKVGWEEGNEKKGDRRMKRG